MGDWKYVLVKNDYLEGAISSLPTKDDKFHFYNCDGKKIDLNATVTSVSCDETLGTGYGNIVLSNGEIYGFYPFPKR